MTYRLVVYRLKIWTYMSHPKKVELDFKLLGYKK